MGRHRLGGSYECRSDLVVGLLLLAWSLIGTTFAAPASWSSTLERRTGDVAAAMGGRPDQAELLHDPEVVADRPVLDDLAIGDAVEVDAYLFS